jgi:hypothetical protein
MFWFKLSADYFASSNIRILNKYNCFTLFASFLMLYQINQVF